MWKFIGEYPSRICKYPMETQNVEEISKSSNSIVKSHHPMYKVF